MSGICVTVDTRSMGVPDVDTGYRILDLGAFFRKTLGGGFSSHPRSFPANAHQLYASL